MVRSRSPRGGGGRRRSAPSALAVLVGLAMLVACGDDGSGGDGIAAGGSSFSEMLARVPSGAVASDSDVEPLVTYVDMDLVWARLGLADASTAEREEEAARLAEVDTYALAPVLFAERATRTEEAEAEVGFTMFDIVREIAVDPGPGALRVVETTASRDDVVAALETDPVWSDRLSEVDGGSGAYFDWTEGDGSQVDVQRRTPMRPIGTGGQLAVGDGDGGEGGTTVVRTRRSDVMEATLATAGGDGGSLADRGPVAEAAAALGEGDVLQAMALVGAATVEESVDEPVDGSVAAEHHYVAPYDAVLLAEVVQGDLSGDDAETRTELVLVHADEDTAAENEDRVRDLLVEGTLPWSGEPLSEELFPDPDVTQDGTVVRVTTTGPGRFAGQHRALTQGDLLLVE